MFSDVEYQDPAGNCGPDVGTHDDANSLSQLHNTAVDESHDHDCGDGAGLHNTRHDRTDHCRCEPISRDGPDQTPQAGSRHSLHSVGHVFHTQKEESQSSH